MITKADVAFACCCMDIDSEATDAGFAFEKGNVFVGFSVLEGRAEVGDSGI